MVLPVARTPKVRGRVKDVTDPNSDDYIVEKSSRLSYEVEYALLRIIL
jgi:hypothetical protein